MTTRKVRLQTETPGCERGRIQSYIRISKDSSTTMVVCHLRAPSTCRVKPPSIMQSLRNHDEKKADSCGQIILVTGPIIIICDQNRYTMNQPTSTGARGNFAMTPIGVYHVVEQEGGLLGKVPEFMQISSVN
eukprot:scaffold11135_cov30-Prasinocladus_malaysianus.AAC.1